MGKKNRAKNQKKTTSRKGKAAALRNLDFYYNKTILIGKLVPRHINILILLVIALVLLVLAFTDTPQRRGDGNEYYLMMFSFASHGSPDLQQSDINEFSRSRAKDVGSSTSFKEDEIYKTNLSMGYIKSDSGEDYSIHFWLFSLLAAPVMLILQASRIDGLLALQVTNALLFILAMALVLLYSGFERYKKLLFSALMLFSPAMWYLDWSGSEFFSFSLVVAAIAVFTNKKYSLAVLCAALASTQNPPIVFLVLFFLIYGSVDIYQARRFKSTPLLVAAALPVIVPTIFNYIKFGTANIIFDVGAASFSVISFQRTWSFFFDLNQGMLPFLPGVFLFFIFLLFRNWRKKEKRVYELLLIIVLMTLLAETTTNWNSDAEGIMRYAVWVLPLFIWGVIAGANLALKTDKILLGIVVVSQMIVVFSFPAWVIPQHNGMKDQAVYVVHNALAGYVLDNHPSLYNPEPEIFAERTIHQEIKYQDHLPVIYSRADGNVTKILTDYTGLVALGNYGSVKPGFLQSQKESHQGDDGIFYIDLSPGEMRVNSKDKN